jgi:hypothetical protein
MRWGLGRGTAALVAVALLTVAMLASPPRAVALVSVAMLASPPQAGGCTPCVPPFREWLGDAPVAVYRLDRAHSRWSERKDWLDDEAATSCGLSGTLVFRRIDTIRGRAPAAITVRMKTVDDLCPWYPYTNGPLGRWIVVVFDDGLSWWHVKGNGVIDSDSEGEGGPDVPEILAAWYRDVRAPDTATAETVAHPAAPRSPVSPWLIVAAAGGLIISLRRSRWRDLRTAGSAK